MREMFRHAMVRYITERSLVGYSSNADIAGALRCAFDPGITEVLVASWRKRHPAFDRACKYAVQETHAELTMIAADHAKQGDMQTLRWILERTCPTFMPKSKTELGGRVNTLHETLTRRSLTEDEARDRGLIYDGEDEDISN